MTTPETLVIVGAGFAGTVTAINLLGALPPGGTRVVLIDRGPEVGRGVAYARRGYPYRLNVPAARMSALANHPSDFLNFALHRQPDVTPGDFLSRELYGTYLRCLLDDSVARRAPGVNFEVLIDSVAALRRPERTAPFTVELSGGRTIEAEIVVLATGNPPPRQLMPGWVDRPEGALIQDPWRQLAASTRSGALLIVGSGLTMVDIAGAALDRDPTREIHVLSRHGLAPCAQHVGESATTRDEVLAAVLASSRSVRQLCTAVRQAAARAEAAGGHWQDVVMQVRHSVPAIWDGLSDTERSRFLRHVRVYWDIHRHRVPGDVSAELDLLVGAGRLTLHAGRLQSIATGPAGTTVSWVPRGSATVTRKVVGDVINCTGPDYHLARSTDPLWRCLMGSGLVTPDSLGQGLVTTSGLAVIDQSGAAVEGLYYIGPLLRARYWEATAVAELRVHAARLAADLAATSVARFA